LVCHTSEPAKTAALIEMLFGLRTRMGRGNHALDRGADPPCEGQFWGKGRPIVMYGYWVHSMVICAKTAQPIDMPFGLWARTGQRNHV